MSITLEVRGRTSSTWPLSTSCIGQIERLRRTEAGRHVDLIFGGEDWQAGVPRTTDRVMLLEAVRQLLPAAKQLPAGFEVCAPPHGGLPGGTARGQGGVLIRGQYYYVSCWDDYWTMQSPEEMQARHEPVKHYEPAELQSENMGIIIVQPKKSRRSDLAKVLRELDKFLEEDSGADVTIIWG